MIILTGKADSYAQFITVLFIFVAVLAVTALVTKWIAGYQKQQGAAGNIEVRETVRIANNNTFSWSGSVSLILPLRSARIP